MTLRKKERRLTIAVGLIIGVTASSFLVKHALNVKNEQAALKPGNYNSLHSAIGDVKFPPLPAWHSSFFRRKQEQSAQP